MLCKSLLEVLEHEVVPMKKSKKGGVVESYDLRVSLLMAWLFILGVIDSNSLTGTIGILCAKIGLTPPLWGRCSENWLKSDSKPKCSCSDMGATMLMPPLFGIT